MPASLKQAGNEQHTESTEVTLARDAETGCHGAEAYKISQIISQRSTVFGSNLMKSTLRKLRKGPPTGDELVCDPKSGADLQYRYSRFSSSNKIQGSAVSYRSLTTNSLGANVELRQGRT